MLQVQHVHKSYGITTILHDVGFVLNAGEHVGLVGANGAGKSTLLRCIARLEQLDQGSISLGPGTRIGYLPQALTDGAARTLGEAIALAQAEARAAEEVLQQAAEALALASDPDAALAAYDAALARFEALGGYAYEQQAAAVLDGLGLSAIAPATPLGQLSGGQKTRLGLAALLLGSPDLLLLDEPTNHLDVTALEWLEGFVQRYAGAVLVASHDREFLDRTTTRTLYLDPLTRTLRSYAGGYSAFAVTRAKEHEQQLADYKQQQEYVAQVEADIARMKGYALGIERGSTPKDHDAKFFLDQKIGAKRLAQKARARERKLERYLASEERVEKPRNSWGLKLDFGQPPAGGRAVLRVEDLAFGYQAQSTARSTQNDLLFEHRSFEVDYGERVALVGPNGAGKTTLLRLIAGELQPTHGTIRLSSGVKLGFMAQEQDTLDPQRAVIDHVLRARPLSETEARTFLHQFLFGGDSVFRLVRECSYGERSRLQLALLVLQGCNLLLLDEPLNHLDIDGREHFEAALEAYAGTVIAVAHDRAFLRSFAERLIAITP